MTKWRFIDLPLATLILGLFLIGCENRPVPEGLRSFYPLPSMLKEPKVYRYISLLDTALSDEYRLMQSIGDNKITACIYDEEGRPMQWYTEQVTSSGVVMDQYKLMATTTKGNPISISTKILFDDVFPFFPQAGGIFLFRMKWKGYGADSLKYELIRNRTFMGDTNYEYDGRKLKAVQFKVRDRVETEQDGILPLEFFGIEIYAKDIGLVYYRKKISSERTLEYQLENIYTLEEFKREFKLDLKFPEIH